MKRVILYLTTLMSGYIAAAELQVKVTDAEGKPLPYAVVDLINPDYVAHAATEPAQVIQQDLNFQPFVSVIPQGTLVEFPNLDKTRHHVYSFSKAKTFELRLYVGKAEAPVLFDQAGIVTLGCNIHDNMVAHLYVSGSQFSAVTNANGEAYFTDLPETDFQLKLWHPWQQADIAASSITITPGMQQSQISTTIVPQTLPKAPKKGFGDY